LNTEINLILQEPDIRAKFASALVQPAGGSPEDFAATIRKEMEKWGPIIKDTGAKLD
jgi:tripartite-type tricarboxylate transporter receptor subunit TctC